jgi:putative ATP-dependent endonuclease of OLD family
MQVVSLHINNFRGVKKAELLFQGHTLFVGMNNVGKSTVCEALELVLGLDRLKRRPPVEEFDFYNAQYLDKSADPVVEIPIEIEAILTGLSQELAIKCVNQLERWHSKERRLLVQGEVAQVDDPHVVECLRIKTVAKYNREQDEFEAELFFCNLLGPGGQPLAVPRPIRQLFGFIYLRALRTGTRALSLERGSLLDMILQRRKVRTGIWENAIDQLRGLNPAIDEGAADLLPILNSIERRLGQYIELPGGGRATQLFVSQLKREHLRKTISFFLRTSTDQQPVPFQAAGTGTLNMIVLALLSFIAEIKEDNVIFAMEEPELALPPHTQRRVVKYLLDSSNQCFVTSHSPYVIEQFEPEQIRILRKTQDVELTATELTIGVTLKEKIYRRHSRKALAEAVLGSAVIVCEGITEKDIIRSAADVMERTQPKTFYPLDLSGVSVLSVDGEGNLREFGLFFKSLQIRAYSFYDNKNRTTVEASELANAFDYSNEIPYQGAEDMLVAEIPPSRLWQFLVQLRNAGEDTHLNLPPAVPPSDEVKTLARTALIRNKGNGSAGRLIELCSYTELPNTVVKFLETVYADFSEPIEADTTAKIASQNPADSSE